MKVEINPEFYVTIVWSEDLSILEQIGFVKRFRTITNITNQELFKYAREKRELTFAKHISYSTIREIIECANELGIVIKAESMY